MNNKLFDPDRVPVGYVHLFSSDDLFPETEWILLEGQSLDIDLYPELFRVIGFTFGGENGYFTELESDNLYDAVGMFSSTVGLKDFKDEYFDDVIVSGSTYTFKSKELLSLFWNDTLGFNGSADVLNLNVEGDAISYVISGAIRSGLELTFTGTIYDIGTTKEASIEAYLSSSHKVGEVDDPTVTSLVNGLKTCNYTYAEDNFTIYVNPNYVYIEDSAYV